MTKLTLNSCHLILLLRHQKVSELEFLPHVGQTPICPGICPSIGAEVWRARVTGGITPIPVWRLVVTQEFDDQPFVVEDVQGSI